MKAEGGGWCSEPGSWPTEAEAEARDHLCNVLLPLVFDVVDVDPLLGAGVVGAVGEVAAGADAGPVVEAGRGRSDVPLIISSRLSIILVWKCGLRASP